MEKTSYIVMFTLGMTILVALMLSGLFYSTKDQAALNEAVFNKRAILSAISDQLDKPVSDFTDEEVIAIFDKRMEQKVLDMEGDELEGVGDALDEVFLFDRCHVSVHPLGLR